VTPRILGQPPPETNPDGFLGQPLCISVTSSHGEYLSSNAPPLELSLNVVACRELFALNRSVQRFIVTTLPVRRLSQQGERGRKKPMFSDGTELLIMFTKEPVL
jgi:hypothetical protein